MPRRLIFTLGVALLLSVAGCTSTRPFTDAGGRVIPGSIATMEQVLIGGISQSIWFRGVDTRRPAIILLHGGPGSSESALFRHYDAALEKHFLMVYWEQRGTGRSYHSDIPRASMTIAQFERDLDVVVDLVRQRFGKNKVILLGRYDWQVPSVLAEQYFNTIDAPCKRLIWFEQSAHNPPFEEPGRFVHVMVDDVLPLA